MALLSGDELNTALLSLPGWRLNDDGLSISQDFVFKSFSQALGFIVRVGLLAERANHHPDWSNVYNRVSIHLSTHDAGGVSDKDIDMAGKITGLVVER